MCLIRKRDARRKLARLVPDKGPDQRTSRLYMLKDVQWHANLALPLVHETIFSWSTGSFIPESPSDDPNTGAQSEC